MFSPREPRSGRVKVYGCTPGCLLLSLLVSVVLTILVNLLVRAFQAVSGASAAVGVRIRPGAR